MRSWALGLLCDGWLPGSGSSQVSGRDRHSSPEEGPRMLGGTEAIGWPMGMAPGSLPGTTSSPVCLPSLLSSLSSSSFSSSFPAVLWELSQWQACPPATPSPGESSEEIPHCWLHTAKGYLEAGAFLRSNAVFRGGQSTLVACRATAETTSRTKEGR